VPRTWGRGRGTERQHDHPWQEALCKRGRGDSPSKSGRSSRRALATRALRHRPASGAAAGILRRSFRCHCTLQEAKRFLRENDAAQLSVHRPLLDLASKYYSKEVAAPLNLTSVTTAARRIGHAAPDPRPHRAGAHRPPFTSTLASASTWPPTPTPGGSISNSDLGPQRATADAAAGPRPALAPARWHGSGPRARPPTASLAVGLPHHGGIRFLSAAPPSLAGFRAAMSALPPARRHPRNDRPPAPRRGGGRGGLGAPERPRAGRWRISQETSQRRVFFYLKKMNI
jgi:hypothetical protein